MGFFGFREILDFGISSHLTASFYCGSLFKEAKGTTSTNDIMLCYTLLASTYSYETTSPSGLPYTFHFYHTMTILMSNCLSGRMYNFLLSINRVASPTTCSDKCKSPVHGCHWSNHVLATFILQMWKGKKIIQYFHPWNQEKHVGVLTKNVEMKYPGGDVSCPAWIISRCSRKGKSGCLVNKLAKN